MVEAFLIEGLTIVPFSPCLFLFSLFDEILAFLDHGEMYHAGITFAMPVLNASISSSSVLSACLRSPSSSLYKSQ
jgi:hypothetical protein